MNKKYTRKQILESIKYWQKQLKNIDESAFADRSINYGAKIDLQSSLSHYLNLPSDYSVQVTYNHNKSKVGSSLVVVDSDDIPTGYDYYEIDKMRSRSDISIEIITKKAFSYDDWDKLANMLEKTLYKMFGPGFSLHHDEPFMVPYNDKIGRTWYIAFVNFMH